MSPPRLLSLSFLIGLVGACASSDDRGAPPPEADDDAVAADGHRLEEGLPDTDRAFSLVVEARTRLEAGDAEAALVLLDEALGEDPGLGIAHLEWALAAQHLGADGDEVAARLDRAVALAPDNARAHMARAAFAHARGRTSEAVAGYREGLGLRPDDTLGRLKLARALLAEGDAALARAEFERVLTQDPAHVGAHVGLAEAAEASGDVDKARATLEALVELRPGAIGHRRRLIAFYLRHDDGKAAAKQQAAMSEAFPVPDRKLRDLKPSRGAKKPKRR